MDLDSIFFDDWVDGSSVKVNSTIFRGDTSADNSNLDISALCCDEQVSGFDKESGKTWIYPTNYSVRDYQFNIIKSAIFKNTLVSLPTGLGKTFIAAVIMYNFYRWYPLGKIVFTAPTRPLVAQQIDACYHIMGIPPGDTIEMTGGLQVAARKKAWKEKRVFFATPQVVYNDLKAGVCPGDLIKCLVFDEAHRARGKYAYCQIVEILSNIGNKTFRVLALSATPGSKVEDVITVVRNLQIAHLEMRSEQCLDVAMYSHSRKIQTIVVSLGQELTHLRNEYIQILDLYTRRLVQYKVLTGNPASISKGRIVMLFKEYQEKERGSRHPQHKQIMQDFLMVITLYHGMELLTKHGARVFLNFFDDHNDKTWVGKDDRMTALLERLRDDLGTNPMSLNRSSLPDGTYPEIPDDIQYGHPKFDRLREIILEHFKEAEKRKETTKAIVFCEYRESVNLVHCLLLQCRPLIKPQMFIGQGTGGSTSAAKDHMKAFTQKQQLRVMQAFRSGLCNTLVSTSVGEEGLDIGNVDLIICFDISTKSPVRLVQRCGRTGRERGGRVVLLVTEGREHQTLKDCIYQRDSLNKRVIQSKEVEKNLYAANPRMLPNNIIPQCQKMFISVEKKEAQRKLSKNQDLRTMLGGKNGSSNESIGKFNFSNLLTKQQFEDIFECDIPNNKCLESVNLTEWLEWQRSLQATIKIGHSSDTETFSALLKYADSKRFKLPAQSQNPDYCTQINTQNLKLPPPKKSNVKKKIKTSDKRDGDIRALFSNATKSTKEYTEMVDKLSSNDGNTIPTNLINLIVELKLENVKKTESLNCLTCDKLFGCSTLNMSNDKYAFPISDLPDINFLDDLTADILREVNIKELVDSEDDENDFFDESIFIDNDSNIAHIDVIEPKENVENSNFDIGNLDDIFADSSTSENKNYSPKVEDKTLDFFGLGSVDDIFADDEISIRTNVTKKLQERPSSPSLLSGFGNNFDSPSSPILSSQFKKVNHCKDGAASSTPIVLNTSFTRASDLLKKINGNNNSDVFNETTKEIRFSHLNNNSTATKSNAYESMYSVTQIIDLVNRDDDGEMSPILSSQIHRHRSPVTQNKANYQYSPILKTNNKKLSCTKQLDFSVSTQNSPFFELESPPSSQSYTKSNKVKVINNVTIVEESSDDSDRETATGVKRKANNSPENQPKIAKLSLREKLATAMKATTSFNGDADVFLLSQKENKNPNLDKIKFNKLQRFTRDAAPKLNGNNIFENDSKHFDSDDEFLEDGPIKQQKRETKTAFQKRRKRKKCDFIEYEAELSDDSQGFSDESQDRSQSSEMNGSIVDFICDEEPEAIDEAVDVQAIYLRSVRSPNQGTFKIPQIAPKNHVSVLSQIDPEYEVSYEIDSFCVDGHVGLTQSVEMTELEIAEALLKEKRRKKRKQRLAEIPSSDRPAAIKNPKKRARLRIESDSSDDEIS